MFEDDDTNQEDTVKSKSQIKREMLALQELGETLVELPLEQLRKFNLPEKLHDAVMEARKIHQHGARKRQLQYVGRIMRDIDAGPIQSQLDIIQNQSKQATQALHRVERWREQLITDGDDALHQLLDQYPGADRQYLRQLIRNAQKESSANKPPKAARSLFRYLRELLSSED